MESYQYSYDKNSNITKKTEVNNYPKEEKDKVNETKAYTYDALGRLTKTVTTDHKNDDRTKTVTYTYDKAGNRTKEDDGTTQTAYTYNGLDQLQTATKEKEPQLTKSASTAMMPMGIRQMSKTQRLDRQNPILMMQRTA